MRGSHTSQQYKQGEGYPTATQGEAYWHYENNLQQQGYQFGDKRLSQPQAYSSGAESHMPNHHSYSQVVRTGTPQQGTKHRGGMTGPVPGTKCSIHRIIQYCTLMQSQFNIHRSMVELRIKEREQAEWVCICMYVNTYERMNGSYTKPGRRGKVLVKCCQLHI